jgi:hypothetical protein
LQFRLGLGLNTTSDARVTTTYHGVAGNAVAPGASSSRGMPFPSGFVTSIISSMSTVPVLVCTMSTVPHVARFMVRGMVRHRLWLRGTYQSISLTDATACSTQHSCRAGQHKRTPNQTVGGKVPVYTFRISTEFTVRWQSSWSGRDEQYVS